MKTIMQPQMADIQTVIEIQNFLYYEAYLLDNRKFEEWLDLLADDIVYQMPMRETLEGIGVNDITEEMRLYDETKTSLTTRVKRLYTKSAWVENPRTRQRHFISNIAVYPTDNEDEYKVISYFFFKRSRASEERTEEMFGERHDIIRKVDDRWEIAARTIYPDQSVITTMNISMFL